MQQGRMWNPLCTMYPVPTGEVRRCDPFPLVRPLSRVWFKDTGMANEREREPGEPGHTRDFLPRPGTVLYPVPVP